MFIACLLFPTQTYLQEDGTIKQFLTSVAVIAPLCSNKESFLLLLFKAHLESRPCNIEWISKRLSLWKEIYFKDRATFSLKTEINWTKHDLEFWKSLLKRNQFKLLPENLSFRWCWLKTYHNANNHVILKSRVHPE